MWIAPPATYIVKKIGVDQQPQFEIWNLKGVGFTGDWILAFL